MLNHSEPLLPIQARQAIEDFIAIHVPDEVKDCLTDLLMEWICADVDYNYKHHQIIVVSNRAILDLLNSLDQVKKQQSFPPLARLPGGRQGFTFRAIASWRACLLVDRDLEPSILKRAGSPQVICALQLQQIGDLYGKH